MATKKNSAWRECEGVNSSTGRVKKGWRVTKSGCPKPASGGKLQRAKKAKGCTPLIKRGLKHGMHRGIKACVNNLPADIRSEWEQRIEYKLGKTTGLSGARRRKARRKARR